MNFKKEIIFYPATDKTKQGGGVTSLTCNMILTGDLGVIDFSFSTGAYLSKEVKLEGCGHVVRAHNIHKPDVYLDEHKSCLYLSGKPCYSDGSFTTADELYNLLVKEGDPAVWEKLKKLYKSWIVDNYKKEGTE